MSIFDRIRDKFKPEWEKPIDHDKELQRIFGRLPEDLRRVFGDAAVISRLDNLPKYPSVRYLGDAGFHAFVWAQHMEFPAFPRFLRVVSEGREDVNFMQFEKGEHTTFLASSREFTGRNVYLLTNDAGLIDELARHQFSPTPPWIAYPELGPFAAYTQGEEEYWFITVWLPFWNSLSPSERDAYIDERSKDALSYMPNQEWNDWVATVHREYKGFGNEG
ncbi:hypothetical protein LGN07_15255 [Burkholderia cepacia]|uniref:hypothetical protein n=1 Tax=Burkholderia cepacia TaxID=292 RepID=UPI0012D8E490|nr:hypothetical protein [Burkholderia cepacia]MCA8120078.1 hypothetical protein [Burkholderia cepacia]